MLSLSDVLPAEPRARLRRLALLCVGAWIVSAILLALLLGLALGPETGALALPLAALVLILPATLGWQALRDLSLERMRLAHHAEQLEERMLARTAELEQSNRDLVSFSYSISHDLRAPLRAINGFAHALAEDCEEVLDNQGRGHLARITRASVRMGELIDELLNLSRVSRQPISVRELDLSAMTSELFEELRIGDPTRKVRFVVQPDMHSDGDETLLRNALSNLLHNAWKFTRTTLDAEISVTAVAMPEHMIYTVCDNGVGFEMGHAKRLFQPFQQLHADQGFGGTGIGLASVRRIVERHGGKVWAESSPGQGARFIFTLPHRAAVVRRRREQKRQ